MSNPSPEDSNLRRAHPLAAALIERLRAHPHARVLEIGAGSGRNTAALRDAGLGVTAIADSEVPHLSSGGGFDAALSTHALLHGTPAGIAAIVATIAQALKPQAAFYATFGSKRDARYGKGTQIGADAFAPDSGDERGVAHAYFDQNSLREMLEAQFFIESLQEQDVDDIAGRWAHMQRPQGSVHWFVHAHRQ